MTYFKIIENKKVIDVGCVFLKWNSNRHKYYICDIDEGQIVQGYVHGDFYTSEWMKPSPPDATKYPILEVDIIDETEFEDLLAILDEGETVEVAEEPVIIPQDEAQNAPEEEKPMSISEMRATILAQQKQIEMLLDKIQ